MSQKLFVAEAACINGSSMAYAASAIGFQSQSCAKWLMMCFKSLPNQIQITKQQVAPNSNQQVSQEHMWQKLGSLLQKLHASVVAVWHVQRVLAKKRDPLTHVLFIDECLEEADPLPSEQIW